MPRRTAFSAQALAVLAALAARPPDWRHGYDLARHFAPGTAPRWQPLEIAEARFFALHALPPDTTPATHRRLAELQEQRFDTEYW